MTAAAWKHWEGEAVGAFAEGLAEHGILRGKVTLN